MKQRIPDSFEHAITIIIAEFGADECGRIIGKSASLIHKASDPDHGFSLDLNQALALDKEYVRRTGNPPPITSVMQRDLNLSASPPVPKTDIGTLVLGLSKEVGEASAKLLEVTADGSASGRKLSPKEALQLMGELDDVERAARLAKVTVRSSMERE